MKYIFIVIVSLFIAPVAFAQQITPLEPTSVPETTIVPTQSPAPTTAVTPVPTKQPKPKPKPTRAVPTPTVKLTPTSIVTPTPTVAPSPTSNPTPTPVAAGGIDTIKRLFQPAPVTDTVPVNPQNALVPKNFYGSSLASAVWSIAIMIIALMMIYGGLKLIRVEEKMLLIKQNIRERVVRNASLMQFPFVRRYVL